jgi:hypothetical protein
MSLLVWSFVRSFVRSLSLDQIPMQLLALEINRAYPLACQAWNNVDLFSLLGFLDSFSCLKFAFLLKRIEYVLIKIFIHRSYRCSLRCLVAYFSIVFILVHVSSLFHRNYPNRIVSDRCHRIFHIDIIEHIYEKTIDWFFTSFFLLLLFVKIKAIVVS